MRRTVILGILCTLVMLALAGNAPALDTSRALSSGPNIRALALSGNRTALRALAAPGDSCVGVDDPNAPIAAQEVAMECMVNFARQEAGLPKLADSRRLDGSADNKAADILRCNQFSHEACGRDFLFWFRRADYLSSRCWWAGENLAWGSGSLGTVRSVMKAWLHSPSHRANLLGAEYDEFGISLRVGALGGSSSAHLWVNHFGHHC
ncbi:MAG TPA: CAP domain-containing protein [Solirubrobacterales bacterium]|jgi:uncharacterized protein YkwD